MRRFLMSCYQLEKSNGLNMLQSSSDSEEDHVARNTCDMILEHKLTDVDIRRTSVEFEQCFAAGSIPVFVLRKSIAVLATDDLSRELKRFSACVHSEGPSVCSSCVSSLLATSQELVDDIPAVSRLAEAISNASMYGVECPNIIRNFFNQ